MFFRTRKDFDKDDLQSVIDACISGNAAAERTLISLFLGYAKNITVRYTTNKQEAEEVVNDAFLKMFQNLPRYDKEKPFKPWLRTILINTALDHYRKNQKHNHQLDIDDIQVVDVNEGVLAKMSADEILVLINSLPPSFRVNFMLYAVEGYTHKEIAELMGIQEGTSKSNVRDARRKLQVLIRLQYPHLYLAYSNNNKINEN